MTSDPKHGDTRTPRCAIQTEGVSLSEVLKAASEFGIDPNWFDGDSQTHRYELLTACGRRGLIEHTVFAKTSIVICSYLSSATPVAADQVNKEFETWVTEVFEEIGQKSPCQHTYGFEFGQSLVWIKPHGVEAIV
jgi:hypothetical protein